MAGIDERFIVKLQGKDFVTYEGLLDLAHQKGLKSIEVVLIQIPTKENNMTAICMATAKTENEIYTDIGDAGPTSTNRMIAPHIIRMASTRAKARALRDLTNAGMTAIEELGEDVAHENSKHIEVNKEELKCSSCGAEINQAVSTFSKNKFGKELCRDCQAKEKK